MTTEDQYIIYSFIDQDYQPYYVGQTASLAARLKMHLYLIRGRVANRYQKASNYPYYRKARKLMSDGSMLRVLILKQQLTREQADFYETQYIDRYRQDPNIKLYNFLSGGRSGQKGKFVSEETKAKISAAKKGKLLSEAHKQALRSASRKKPQRSNEQRKQWIEKLRLANTGKKMSEEANEKNRLAHLGLKFSDTVNKRKGRSGILHPNSKIYTLISPEGERYILHGISRTFCKEHNLIQSGLWLALHRKNNTYKGWKIWEGLQD